MAIKTPPLTDTQIKSLKATNKDKKYFDGGLISLILKFRYCLFEQIFTPAKINYKSKINEYAPPTLGDTFLFRYSVEFIKNKNIVLISFFIFMLSFP